MSQLPAIPDARPGDPIRYFDRGRGVYATEVVFGERWVKAAYHNPLGRLATHTLLARPWLSVRYGRRMSRPDSAALVAPFVQRYGLDPSEFADPIDAYGSFNDFFARKLRPDARPVDPAPGAVVFPADGRHLGFERASAIESVFVKGQRFDLVQLLGSEALAARFADGPLVLSRLCPVDYHRFHFPVDGVPGAPSIVQGPLFSVSPYALRRNLSYLWRNRRQITLIDAGTLGTVAAVEVGATMVGAIHQSFSPGQPVRKGDEKGWFAFGGSSTLTLFEPGAVRLDDDLLRHSAERCELYARMGEHLGVALR